MKFKIHFNRNTRNILALAVMLLLIGSGFSVFSCSTTGAVAKGWSGAIISDNSLFIGSMEGKLISVDLNGRNRRWPDVAFTTTAPPSGFGCSPTSAPVAIYGTPALGQDLVYVGGYDGKVYGINANTGASRWVYPRQNSLQPIVGGLLVDSGAIYFGDAGGKVYSLDALTGDLRWQFSTGDKIWSTAAVDGDTLYIGSFDKKLYALNTANGNKRWEFTTEGAIASSPVVANKTVYIGSFDRRLYAINAADGNLKWRSQVIAGNWFWSRPVITGDVVYAANLDGKVYAFNAGNGSQTADLDLGSPVSSSLVMSDSSVIVATEGGQVFAIDTATNQKRVLATLKENIYAPLYASNGVVYVHSEKDNLLAIDIKTGTTLWTLPLKS